VVLICYAVIIVTSSTSNLAFAGPTSFESKCIMDRGNHPHRLGDPNLGCFVTVTISSKDGHTFTQIVPFPSLISMPIAGLPQGPVYLSVNGTFGAAPNLPTGK
jgi:hypothetical protein